MRVCEGRGRLGRAVEVLATQRARAYWYSPQISLDFVKSVVITTVATVSMEKSQCSVYSVSIKSHSMPYSNISAREGHPSSTNTQT